jgi:hypothetical protein
LDQLRTSSRCVTRALIVQRLWYAFRLLIGMRRGGASSRAIGAPVAR